MQGIVIDRGPRAPFALIEKAPGADMADGRDEQAKGFRASVDRSARVKVRQY